MMRAPLLIAALLLASGAKEAPHPAPDAKKPGEAETPSEPASALPAFAADLAHLAPITGPEGWKAAAGADDWRTLARAPHAKRQEARWRRALAMIGRGRGPEALGILETMRGDDPDLPQIASFRLAQGAALVLLRRDTDALTALAEPRLTTNAEACAWRLRAYTALEAYNDARGQVNCALPALNARTRADGKPFVLAAAEAAIVTGAPDVAMRWLRGFPDSDPAASLLRGRAQLALGSVAAGRLAFDIAAHGDDAQVRAAGKLGEIEAELAGGKLNRAKALDRLEALRFAWRGGSVERRALKLELKLANEAHDLRRSLRAGATLLRYFAPGRETGAMLATLQHALSEALAPESDVPLPEAAGLYWEYRELAPAGAEGDLLVNRLAARLQAAELYARAAELLQYQLFERLTDVAQGPMSVKVAGLHILAGEPERAIKALRDTEQPGYPQAMQLERKRIEAIALHKLGKDKAAMAALEGVPGADAVRAEILWQAQDWNAFVATNGAILPGAGSLDPSGQATVLRHAIALGMLAREDALQALRARYAKAFKPLKSAGSFDLLTQKLEAVDPAKLRAAMTAVPSASPAGPLGDLIDAAS